MGRDAPATFEQLSEAGWSKLRNAHAVLLTTASDGPADGHLDYNVATYEATARVVCLAFAGLRQRGNPTAEDADNLYKLWRWRVRLTLERRLEALGDLRLPRDAHAEIVRVMEEYQARGEALGDAEATIGCWGTGKGTLVHDLRDPAALEWYFGLLAEVADAGSREDAYQVAGRYCAHPVSGIAAGVVSPTLYCLRPRDFPVLNKPVIDAVRKSLGLVCSADLRDYLHWSRSATWLNAELGLPADLATFDRLFYGYVDTYERHNEGALLALDGRALGLLAMDQRTVDRAYQEAQAALREWADDSDNEDFSQGVTLLARTMATMLPGGDAASLERRLMSVESAHDLWMAIGAACEWPWRVEQPWPVAVSQLLDWFPVSFTSWMLAAASDFGDVFAPVCASWWAACGADGLPFTDRRSGLTKMLRKALEEASVSECEQMEIEDRVLDFLTRCDQMDSVCWRYRATGDRAIPFLERLFGAPWPDAEMGD